MTEKRTILVVDDEPDIVRSVHDLLRMDYRVLGTTDPQEGLDLLDQEDVQVVMSDQRMPDMSGVEFLWRCRETHPETVRLLFTGYSDLDAVIDAINEGSIYRYVNKPWNPQELAATIREAVERWELVDERARLVRELEQKNRELEATNAALVTEKELRTSFIKVASHELRAPLTILLGSIDLAARAAKDTDEPLLARLHDAGERLRVLIDGLVRMLEAGRFDALLVRKPVDLAALLRRADVDVRPFAELRGQTLETTVADDAGTAALDEDRVRDLLDHLLLNAIKFTPDGGRITLGVERAPGDRVLFRVRDDGDGIAPDEQRRLFDPFFTTRDVSRHCSGRFEYRAQGLGLGLSVVKAIVDRHGGTIEVDSRPGHGTTFTISLPAG